MISKRVFLYAPAAFGATGLLAFIAFHAWPLSPVGVLFGRQPGYRAGSAGQVLLASVPLWYLAGYGAAWLLRLPGSAWTRPIAGVVAAAVIGFLTFAELFAAGMGGRVSSGGFGLWPFHALSMVAEPATRPLRNAHYVAHLADRDVYRRTLAASGLAMAADDDQCDGRPALQLGIARGLASEDESVRASLRLALQRCYPLARPALAEVVARLADGPEAARAEVAELLGTLGWYGQSEPELREGLLRAAASDPDRTVRRAAAAALLRFSDGEPDLVALLERWAAEGDAFGGSALAMLPGHEPSAADAFRRRLADPDPAVRAAWTAELGSVRRLEPSLLEPRAAALHALTDPEARVRLAAVEVLKEGGADPVVQRAMTRALADPSAELRERAAWAIYSALLDDRTRPVLPEVRRALIAGLADPAVLPAAYAVLQDRPDAEVARAALAALPAAEGEGPGKLGVLLRECKVGPQQIRTVAGLLASERPGVASAALHVLEQAGARDPAVQVALAKAVAARRDDLLAWQASRILHAEQRALAPEARAILEGAAAVEGEAGERAREALGK